MSLPQRLLRMNQSLFGHIDCSVNHLALTRGRFFEQDGEGGEESDQLIKGEFFLH
jgi:hypothetical protein